MQMTWMQIVALIGIIFVFCGFLYTVIESTKLSMDDDYELLEEKLAQ